MFFCTKISMNKGNKWLSIVAFWEGCSFLALAITMPLKYIWALKGPNMVVGMAHGFLFILYCLLVVLAAFEQGWKLKRVALAFLASLLPFGTFIAEKKGIYAWGSSKA
ncbi:MAG: DUF3817 domain-containing protein [Bacteroidetes bacterium]|nr:MAG: DUF3817 domain-containing protein [Bacteroidota bacterium]TAF92604.1 MAG: DUF3817 domain-containing protein [Bacteroidota bacterium]